MIKTYNIVVNTQDEKYIVLDYLRSVDVKIVDVAGYYEQYIIHFDCTEEEAEMIDIELSYLLEQYGYRF